MVASQSLTRACAAGSAGRAGAGVMRTARRCSAWAGWLAAGVIECSIRPSTIRSPRSGGTLVEAVNIAAPIELRDKARVIEILRPMQAHLAVIVDFHHLLD